MQRNGHLEDNNVVTLLILTGTERGVHLRRTPCPILSVMPQQLLLLQDCPGLRQMPPAPPPALHPVLVEHGGELTHLCAGTGGYSPRH